MQSRQGYYPQDPKDYSFQSRNMLQNSLRRSYFDAQESYLRRQKQDAEIIFEYELKREKEKVLVLQERLKNKEIFIIQMKQFQKELSKAFDESQEELKYFKLKCEELEDRSGGNLEYEIDQLKRQLKKSEIQRKQLEKELKRGVRDDSKQKQSSRRSLKKQKATIQVGEKTDRHKTDPSTFANGFYKAFNNYSLEQMLNSGNRFGIFCKHFLDMAKTCNPETSKISLKDQLKYSWKWIKGVVKRDVKEGAGLEDTETNLYSKDIKKLFNYKSTKEIVPIIEETLKENKEYKKIIELVMEYHKLGKDVTGKDIVEYFKKKGEKKSGKE